MKTIYLDNAATSFPKPEAVADRMDEYVRHIGATINRSVYAAAQDAGLVAWSLRERLCSLLGFSRPDHVILTAGNTMGLNLLLKGCLRPGDHVLVSSVEHNAVMRPLAQLADIGVSFDRIPCGADGILDPVSVSALLRPNTRLVLINHASNVGGGVQDINAVGSICAERGIPLAVDGAQTAGHWPIDFQSAHLSALSVPGHKGLMGPQGIGALLLAPELAKQLTPLLAGGTGSASDSERVPDTMPDRFEPGTANLPGIFGLEAALGYIADQGVDAIRAHERALTARLLDGIEDIPGIRLVGPREIKNRVGVISVDFCGQDNAEIAYRLETEYGILTRCGQHCAPAAHKALGTFPQGTVRFSLGWFNTETDADAAADAIRALAR